MSNQAKFLWLLCGIVWLPICWRTAEALLQLRWVDKALAFFGG